jgi:hypothetical protein
MSTPLFPSVLGARFAALDPKRVHSGVSLTLRGLLDAAD